jgi:hypothetical protein
MVKSINYIENKKCFGNTKQPKEFRKFSAITKKINGPKSRYTVTRAIFNLRIYEIGIAV